MINIKHSFRTLFKTPFVTAIAILSLALGIGANSAIYSLFNEMLRRPLPVFEPDRLVNLGIPGPSPGSNSCGSAGDCDVVFSYPMFRDLQKASTGFSGLAAHVIFGANLAFNGQTVNADAVMVSGSYFPVLGLKPALGRLLSPQDDTPVGSNFVVVLGYGYWSSQLGSSKDILDKTLIVNGKSMTVVGVAPQGFEGTTLGTVPKIYVPISMRAVLQAGRNDFDDRRSYWAYVFGRLKPGVTMAQAKTSIDAIYSPIIQNVEAPLQKGMSDATMKLFKAKLISVEDGRRGQSSLHKETKTPIMLLFGITGIVLLIACANIANLLLARGAGRSMEMAVRLSLGATRGQIISQLLTESVLLALMGGAASIIVAKWTLVAMAGLLPTDMATDLHFTLDSSAMVFAAFLSLGTGFLFGLFPAIHSTNPELASIMRDSGSKSTGMKSAARFRAVLVTAQIALSMALLVSAGLFVKSLNNVASVDLGIKTERMTLFAIAPVLNGYDPARSHALFARVEEELAAIPGVSGVSAARVALLANNNWGNSVHVQGFKNGPDIDNGSRFNEVGPGYFKLLGVPILAGREFTAADELGGAQVAIVNETFAKKFGLGRDAVGKFMSQGGDTLNVQIVGLVRDAKYSSVKKPVPPVYFVPYKQDSTVGGMHFYLRSGIDPAQIERAIPGVIKKLDQNLPIEDLKTLDQQIKDNVFLDRMISTLSAGFAALATLLAAIGLYGVLAYSVAQRTREIGVRMALGASGRSVQQMVLKQVGWMTLWGGLIGLAAAIAIGQTATSLLFELKGYDPLVMAASIAVLTGVAFGAGYFPALRASRIDPMQALRHE